MSGLSPFPSVFPEFGEAALRQGLRILLAGEVDRFTHAHVAETPRGPQSQPWEITLFRAGAARHFMAVPEGVADAAAARTTVGRALRKAIARRSKVEHHTLVGSSDGDQRRVCVTPIHIGRRDHLLAFQDDLPDHAEATATERLLSAQEEERHRIAIELHDSTSQHLVAVSLSLARLSRLAHATRAELRTIEDMSRSVQEAIREIRTISYLMNPPQLERDGLQATAQRFIAGFQTRAGIKTILTLAGSPDAADTAIQHMLFRLLQEALTNIFHQAKASRVDVALARRRGRMTLTIADDAPAGIAGGEAHMRAPIGVGVAGMRAPVNQLGGSLRVSHGPDGSLVTARLPAAGERGRRRQTAGSPARADP